MLSRVLGAVMGAAARRPLAVGASVVVLAVAAAGLALRLEASTTIDTLVGSDAPSFAATQTLHERFGDDAIIVLVRQPLTQTVLTSDLLRVLSLEGCLSGERPAGGQPRGGRDGPCARLAALRPARVVFGPGTFLNEAVGQVADQFQAQLRDRGTQADRAAVAARGLARSQGRSEREAGRLGDQARQLVYAEFARDAYALALKYGIRSAPALNDPSFVARIVFAEEGAPGTPKARFAYLFPGPDSALIQVRLRPDLDDRERAEAIGLVRRAVAMADWRLPNGGGSYVMTGAPVVVAALGSSITDAMLVLLVGVLAVMALTLAVVFGARRRLLPLAVALAGAALTFGALSLAGGSLTMAAVGVLPVLVGLGVDYAIQIQARVTEERRAGEGLEAAVARTATRGAPTVAVAAAATAAGFLVLTLSPVPMVRGFGLLLVAGIVLTLGCALTLGIAGLAAGRRGHVTEDRDGATRGVGARLAPTLRGAGELSGAGALGRRARAWSSALATATLRAAIVRPGRVLAIALAVAAVGWAADTQTRVESDVQRLVPRDGALADLQALQRSTGVGGQIDVVVSGRRLTEPGVVAWMGRYQDSLLRRYGYSERRGCGRADLCPAFSLPDLFGAGSARSRERIEALLDAVPPSFSQGVISRDRRTATLAFGIRLMSLERQQEVITEMARRLRPPAGVNAELAGLPVLAAQTNARVASPWRRLALLLAGLGAVALVLLAALRSWSRALVPLIPIALATGWSALVLFVLRIPLNPMSVTLGALVVAIATEFSVLLSERFRSERAAGHELADALARTYRSTGAAVLASGVTAIAGFAVLVVSDIRMLRNFGFVTVIDLAVALAGVLVVLPAVLVLAEAGRLSIPGAGARARRRRRTPAPAP